MSTSLAIVFLDHQSSRKKVGARHVLPLLMVGKIDCAILAYLTLATAIIRVVPKVRVH